MATSNRYQSALLGGLFIGILSSLPVVGACCCLWVIIGGLLTVYLQQQRQADPLETADAVLTALLAGLIGAILSALGTWITLSVTGVDPFDVVRSRIESNPDMPPQARDFALRLLGGGFIFIWLAVTIPCYAAFSALGSLLGLAFFRKKTPPPAAPTA